MTPYEFTIDDTRVRVVEMDYQRNGVAGVGFWQFTLLCSEAPERPLTAVMFHADETYTDANGGYCAVLDAHRFESHWRGDHFADHLRQCVAAREDEHWSEKLARTAS